MAKKRSFRAMNARRIELIHKKYERDGLGSSEQEELARLQEAVSAYVEALHPRYEVVLDEFAEHVGQLKAKLQARGPR